VDLAAEGSDVDRIFDHGWPTVETTDLVRPLRLSGGRIDGVDAFESGVDRSVHDRRSGSAPRCVVHQADIPPSLTGFGVERFQIPTRCRNVPGRLATVGCDTQTFYMVLSHLLPPQQPTTVGVYCVDEAARRLHEEHGSVGDCRDRMNLVFRLVTPQFVA
jgi:hypothetical protein